MSKFNAGQSFSNGDTVTGPTLNNITGLLDIYTGLISEQTAIVATVSTADQLLIADTDNGDSGAANRVTVQKLLNDTLTNGTYTNAQLSGNLNVAQLSTLGTISSTTGTIQTLTSSTANISQGSAIFTQGTIATLNSTTGTIGTLVATGTITGSTNVVNIGSGQIFKDASGNVGIGTNSPIKPLDVSFASGTRRFLASNDDSLITIKGANASNNPEVLRVIGDRIQFNTGTVSSGTEAMRIDSSGNVGINTTTLSAKLDVRTTGDGNFAARFLNSTTSDSPNGVQIVVGQNSTNAVVDVAQGTSYTSPTSLLRILGNGNIGIGTSSPSAKLELASDSAKKPSTNTWTIASDQRLKANIINADNDRCYEIVKQVPLKRYTWKSEVYSQEQVKDRSKLGWIAQDVEAVFPKAVGTNRFAYNQVFENVVTPELDSDGNAVLDKNGVAKTKTDKRLVSEDVIEDCKNLNSDQIYAAMYGTIQKLIEKVEVLESKVATLEAA